MKLLLALCLLLPSIAKADILFFDLNFSPKEIIAAQAAANARGERLHFFPERTPAQHRELERQYLLVMDLSAKLQACARSGKDCSALSERWSKEWSRMEGMAALFRQVNGAEMERILGQLEAGGVRLSTVIFSGHSGGEGSFGGLLGGLNIDQVKEAFGRHANLLPSIDTVLLWGCYSGTLHSMHEIWRKAFPDVSVFGGFEKQSPLGIRESSGRFLKSFLLNERKMARAAGSLSELHRIFRSLDLVADLDGTALVGKYYLTYDQAADAEEMFGRCQKFDASLMESFECYENGRAGCENPPPDHRGPMRALYSFLQVNRHCTATLRGKYPGLPSTEYLVRLIFLDNVKKNFAAHHRASFGNYDAYLVEAGLPAELSVGKFERSTRAEDVQRFGLGDRILTESGARDYSFVDRPNWRPLMIASEMHQALKMVLGPSGNRSIDGSCVPFSWVEPNAKDKDSCGFSASTTRPVDADMRSRLVDYFYTWRLVRFFADHDPVLGPWFQGPLSTTKMSYKAGLQERLFRLEGYAQRSTNEERWIALYRRLLEEAGPLTDREVLARLMASAEASHAYLRTEIPLAELDSDNERALATLKNYKVYYERYIERLRALAQE